MGYVPPSGFTNRTILCLAVAATASALALLAATTAIGQTVTYGYDGAGRLTSVASSGTKDTYNYDLEGNLMSITQGAGQSPVRSGAAGSSTTMGLPPSVQPAPPVLAGGQSVTPPPAALVMPTPQPTPSQ
jgi:YD repeat-containing protein